MSRCSLQPPTDLKKKAEWRILSSESVRESLKEKSKAGEASSRKTKRRQFDRLKLDEKVRGGVDGDTGLEETIQAVAVKSSDNPRDALKSVFVTSLSASAVGEREGRGVPHKTRKVTSYQW